VCDWVGVTCGGGSGDGNADNNNTATEGDGGRVAAAEVDGLQLERIAVRGQTPTDLAQLTSLTYLELPSDELRGTIPSSLGRLTLL
jgi:hypothetical protein